MTSSRSRQIIPSEKILLLKAGLEKRASIEKGKASRAELKSRKDAWLQVCIQIDANQLSQFMYHFERCPEANIVYTSSSHGPAEYMMR